MRFVMLLVLVLFPLPVWADSVDLVLPPVLEATEAPFYQGAHVKLGDDMMPVQEGSLPKGQLAAYVPEKNAVIISNTPHATEADKGRALLEVLSALEAGAIAPSAGEEE